MRRRSQKRFLALVGLFYYFSVFSLQMDDIMEVACGFLWNITDECPPNCEEFIELGGMKLFQKICEVRKIRKCSN